MKKLYALLLSLTVLSACNKEEEEPGLDYPAAFKVKTLQNPTPIRMYTRNGEVKERALVNAFADRWGKWYNLDEKSKEAAHGGEVFTLLSRTEAELDNGKRYNIQKQGDDLLLTDKKEFTSMYAQRDEYYFNLGISIRKYKPVIFDKHLLAPTAGSPSGYAYKSKDQLVATLSGNDLHVYQLAYTLKSGDKNAWAAKGTIFSNRFDSAVIPLLRDTDTLLVQEFVVVGERVK